MNTTTKLSANFITAILALCVAALAGCSDNGAPSPFGGLSSGGSLTPGGATVLYGVQNGATVPQFSLTTSSSNLTPLANLVAPANTTFNAVATDSSGNLFVGASLSNGATVGATFTGEVLVYPAGSTGAATPTRTITGGQNTTTTTFGVPQSMHISSTGTLAILSTTAAGYSIATMPATSSGTVTPTTLIQGSGTQMSLSQCVTIDQTGTVYVTNYSTATSSGSVLEFAPAATGNVAPTTVITTGGAEPYGIAADASGNVFTILDDPNQVNAGEIAVFAAGASGPANPTRVITGNLTDIFFGGGLRLDSVGNLYMINRDVTGSVFSILAFSQTASGNVAPGLVFQSSALTSPEAEIAIR